MANDQNTPATQQRAAMVAAPQQNAIVSVGSLLSGDAMKARFQELLGKKAAGFMSSIISVSKSPQLRDADPNTIIASAVVAATLDLPINPNLGFAHIVPYKNKGRKEAQFQMGWKGFYQLAMRTGKYHNITSNEVYDGEVTIKNRFKEEIEFGKKKSDKVVGYLAYYSTTTGAEKFFYMTNEEVEKHAVEYSQAYRYDKKNRTQLSPWSTDFDGMAKKTVLKLLLSKYGELSIEQQMQSQLDTAFKFDQAIARNTEENPAEIVIDQTEAEYTDNDDSDKQDQAREEKAAAQTTAISNAAQQILEKNQQAIDRKKAMQEAGGLFGDGAEKK